MQQRVQCPLELGALIGDDDALRPTKGGSAPDYESFSLLCDLPKHLIVEVLAWLGHGSLCRVARTCPALSAASLIDDAARLAVSRMRFTPKMLACAPLTETRRWVHVLNELETLIKPVMFAAARAEALELSPRGEICKCWLTGSALASTGVPMRAGVHQVEVTLDPDKLGDGRDGGGINMAFGLTPTSGCFDPDVAPYTPGERFAIRLDTGLAWADEGAVRQLQGWKIKQGDRVRLRADLDQGTVGVYVNDSWRGLAIEDLRLRRGSYEWFVMFASVGSVSIR